MFDMTVNSDLDRAASFIDALMAGLDARKLREVAGEAGHQVVKDHYFGLAAERHRPGVDFNFWEDAADATSFAVTEDGALIVVDKAGVAQRRYGGTIEAENYSHLWIPVHPAAIGHTGGDFDVHPIINAITGKGVAIEKNSGDVYFALVESVTHDPDPSVDPNDETLLNAVTEAQMQWLESETLQRAGA